MPTPADQQRFVARYIDGLGPAEHYKFALLIVERLLTMSREAFPVGLPTKNVPYEVVHRALEELWGRLETPRPSAALKGRSDNWMPLDVLGRQVGDSRVLGG